MLKIVIAEDHEDFRTAMAKLLQRNGYEVVQSCDGKECLKLVRACNPHVVITDLFMPKMEGMELLIELRHEFPQIPVIVVSGASDATCLKMAGLLGAVHALSKPFEMAELLKAIADVTKTAEGV